MQLNLYYSSFLFCFSNYHPPYKPPLHSILYPNHHLPPTRGFIFNCITICTMYCRTTMKSVCLRRTKTQCAIKLPPKEVRVLEIPFEDDDKHKKAYDSLFESAKATFQAVMSLGNEELMRNYASILETLLRIRQVFMN